MSNPAISGEGSPEFRVFGYAGQSYTDTLTGDIYAKPDMSQPSTTGWEIKSRGSSGDEREFMPRDGDGQTSEQSDEFVQNVLTDRISPAQIKSGEAAGFRAVFDVPSNADLSAVEDLAASRQIVFDGDSMMESYVANAGVANSIPSLLMANSGWARRGAVSNMAVASGKISEIYAQRANLAARFVVTEGRGYYIILAGHNDLNSGETAATLLGYVDVIAAQMRSQGFKIIWITPPSTGSFDSGKQAQRALFVAGLLDREGDEIDYVVDISDLDSDDTTDGTHLTPAANATVVSRIVAKVATPWAEQVLPAETRYGTSQLITTSAYEPALQVSKATATAARAVDTNAAQDHLLRWENTFIFPDFPRDRGIYVGLNNTLTNGQLESEIELTGDFTIAIWVIPSSRVFASGANTAPLIGKDGSTYFALSGNSGAPFFWDGSTNWIFNDLPEIKAGVPQHIVFRRSGSILKCIQNGIGSKPLTIGTSSVYLSRLFSRTTGTYFQGECLGVIVKSGFLSNAAISRLQQLRGADLSGGVGTPLWLDLREGMGYQAFDKSSNKNHLILPTNAGTQNWYWMWPNRESVQIRDTLTFSGSGNMQVLGQVCADTDTIVRELWVHSSGSANITVGNASGGSQIAGSQAVASGLNKITLAASPVSSTGDLWVGSDAAVTLKITAYVSRVDG